MASDSCRIELPNGGPQPASDQSTGCYDQLSLDAARAYPGDKLLQGAAVEEKMGLLNFSYQQQKLMEGYREFAQNPQLQALAVREAEFKYFNVGEALSPKDQAALDTMRQGKEDGARISEYTPEASKIFPQDPKLQELAAKGLAQEHSGRLLLTDSEAARLSAARQYPSDRELQDLAAREIMSQHPGQPKLTGDETARLRADRYQSEAVRQFPQDPELQKLATKLALSTIAGQPQLTRDESARLDAAAAFPGEENIQKLVIAQRLQDMPGHEPLTDAQQTVLAHAVAAREFPADQKLQEVVVQEQLWLARLPGVPGLSREDYLALENARSKRLLAIFSAGD